MVPYFAVMHCWHDLLHCTM